MDTSVGQEVREDLTQGGLVAEDRGTHGFPELPRMVGGDHVRVGQSVQNHGDDVDAITRESSVAVQSSERQHLLHEGGHARPLRRDALERLSAGGLIDVAACELRVSLNRCERRTQLMRGVGDELTELRLAAGAAFHAVLDGVDHRVEGTRDVRDLDGAGGRFLTDPRQVFRFIGEVTARDIRSRRTHDAEWAQLAAHPRAPCEPSRNRDDEGQTYLNPDEHQDHIINAVHRDADEHGLPLNHARGHAERSHSLQAHGVHTPIRGDSSQNRQSRRIQVGHRKVRNDRAGRLAVLAHVLKGALGDAGAAEPVSLRPTRN